MKQYPFTRRDNIQVDNYDHVDFCFSGQQSYRVAVIFVFRYKNVIFDFQY